MTCSRFTPGRSLALSITALSHQPTCRLDARCSTLIMRVKCSSIHITMPPTAMARPGQPQPRQARAATSAPSTGKTIFCRFMAGIVPQPSREAAHDLERLLDALHRVDGEPLELARRAAATLGRIGLGR